MSQWKALSILSVVGLGVLSFLRVVSNEILAVEKRLELLVAAREAEESAKRRWQEAA